MLRVFRNAALAVGVGLFPAQALAEHEWPEWYRNGVADCRGVTRDVCNDRQFLAEAFALVEQTERNGRDRERDSAAIEQMLNQFRNTARTFRQVAPRVIENLNRARARVADEAADAILEGMERSRREAPDRERENEPGSLQDLPTITIAPGFGA